MHASEALTARIRDVIGQRKDIVEKRMFGGVAFLFHGNMLVGVWKTSLIARLGPEAGTAALTEPHVKPFDITGKPMKGWVIVEADGIDTDDQLRLWISRAEEFVATLPRKEATK